jgi:anti-anti-sigma factor
MASLQVTKNDDVFVIRFQDRKLAGDLPEQLGDELRRVAAQEDCTKILLEFSGVEFLASDMLGKVMALNKQLKQKNGRLALCEVCPYIRQVLTVSRLDTLLTIKATEAEGMSALA